MTNIRNAAAKFTNLDHGLCINLRRSSKSDQSHIRSTYTIPIIGIISTRGGSTDLPTEQFQMDSNANPEPTAPTDDRSQSLAPTMDVGNDPSISSITDTNTGTSTNFSSQPTTTSPPNHFQYHRHMTRSDERAILGRAVLTTPHRRMPAIRIATGPRPPFTSPMNPGPIFTATPIFVTKSSLCESLGCALRDLRVIDQFSNSGRYSGPAFLARSNCVIVNVGHVRAIVMRNQVLIFLPEVANGVRRSGCDEASAFDEGRGNMNIHLDGYGNAINADAASTGGQRKNSVNAMMDTIECLVEALVTHLNSIYHSSHHLMFDEGGTDRKLVAKDNTSIGQQWGSGWYSSNNGITDQRSSKDIVSNSKRVKDNTRRPFRKKGKKQKKDTIPSREYQSFAGTSPGPNAPAPPFELVVIEALLGHVCSFKTSKVAQIIQTAKHVLGGITYNFKGREEVGRKKDAFIEMQAKLGELLPLKNKVDELEAKCAEVAGAIAEVLKNDEDMAAMRLSEITGDEVLEGDPDNLHVEVELLFEDYLLQMDEVLVALRSVQSYVRNTEEVVEIELDLLRNRIMRYEMLLELSGLVVGVAAAVTGAFGMNLVNRLEDHPTMFYNVSAALIVTMAAMGYTILRKLSADNIL
eukprot:scaffold1275_cov247-Chaetoceros_neogracile.AAC.6